MPSNLRAFSPLDLEVVCRGFHDFDGLRLLRVIDFLRLNGVLLQCPIRNLKGIGGNTVLARKQPIAVLEASNGILAALDSAACNLLLAGENDDAGPDRLAVVRVSHSTGYRNTVATAGHEKADHNQYERQPSIEKNGIWHDVIFL